MRIRNLLWPLVVLAGFFGLLALRSIPDRRNFQAARGMLGSCYQAGGEFLWGCGIDIRRHFEEVGNPVRWRIVSENQERDNRHYRFLVDVDYAKGHSRDTVVVAAGPSDLYGYYTNIESYESEPR